MTFFSTCDHTIILFREEKIFLASGEFRTPFIMRTLFAHSKDSLPRYKQEKDPALKPDPCYLELNDRL